jgi:dihydrolipoamide dehydrogenase
VVQVTVIEFLDTITPSLDSETAKSFQKILKKQGFKFKLGSKVLAAACHCRESVTHTYALID